MIGDVTLLTNHRASTMCNSNDTVVAYQNHKWTSTASSPLNHLKA